MRCSKLQIFISLVTVAFIILGLGGSEMFPWRERHREPPPRPIPMEKRVDVSRGIESPNCSSHSSSSIAPFRNRIVLTTTNLAFLDFTSNLLRSIARSGSHHVTVIAEDEISFKQLSNSRCRYPSLNLTVVQPSNHKNVTRYLKFGSDDYNKFVNKRPSYLLHYLEQGYEVFFNDADLYWYRDPFPYFVGDFDVAMAKDRFDMYNAGLGFYRPTKSSISFVRRWVKILRTQRTNTPDQNVMNTIISSASIPDLVIKVLNNENFPNGGFFFTFFPNMTLCREDTSTTVVFHAAWISGHTLKKESFQKCNIWFEE